MNRYQIRKNTSILFSNNMKYLVTGGLGFIGSNLCRHLSNKKNRILIIDNLSYAGSRSSLKN